MDRCDCGGAMTKEKIDYVLLGTNLGKFDALVCKSCGETIFLGTAMKEIEKRAKAAGLWGIAARTRIGTSGNALDVKLPKSLVEFFKLKKGQEVLVEPLDRSRFEVIIQG